MYVVTSICTNQKLIFLFFNEQKILRLFKKDDDTTDMYFILIFSKYIDNFIYKQVLR